MGVHVASRQHSVYRAPVYTVGLLVEAFGLGRPIEVKVLALHAVRAALGIELLGGFSAAGLVQTVRLTLDVRSKAKVVVLHHFHCTLVYLGIFNPLIDRPCFSVRVRLFPRLSFKILFGRILKVVSMVYRLR